jgi:NTE family protein
MFGAYQAGAWQGLAEWFRPDIVVGASIGALNGWAIAGSCPPGELEARWSDLPELASWRFCRPWKSGGLFDSSAVERSVRLMHSGYRPAVKFGVVLTDVWRMKPEMFTEGIGWEHLAGSCAVPLLLPPRRIGGRMYTDGGLLESLPLWAAAALGAEKILAIQVLPHMPSAAIRMCVRGLRAVAGKPPAPGREIEVATLGPEQPLGRPVEMMEWNRDRARAWMNRGRAEAEHKKQALKEMFCE